MLLDVGEFAQPLAEQSRGGDAAVVRQQFKRAWYSRPGDALKLQARGVVGRVLAAPLECSRRLTCSSSSARLILPVAPALVTTRAIQGDEKRSSLPGLPCFTLFLAGAVRALRFSISLPGLFPCATNLSSRPLNALGSTSYDRRPWCSKSANECLFFSGLTPAGASPKWLGRFKFRGPKSIEFSDSGIYTAPLVYLIRASPANSTPGRDLLAGLFRMARRGRGDDLLSRGPASFLCGAGSIDR